MVDTAAAAGTASVTETAHKHVGRRMRRADAPERLVGQLRFTADLPLPGALHARFVRSPYAAARIQSIDPAPAMALPGVVAVYTARDLPVVDLAQAVENRTVLLALDRVVHAGQPVAVVMAESDVAAEDGAAAVQVEYEPLPVAVDPFAATAADAPVVRERRERDDAELAMHGAAPTAEEEEDEAQPQAPNVASRTRHHRGDVERGFAAADVVIEREFRTSWIHQGYIEPQACAAVVDPLGNLVVYTSTQALFHVRNEVAQTLGLPDHQVKIQPLPVGGGFGGKFGLLEPLTAALARLAAPRPVLVVYHRVDEFALANPAPESIIHLKVGARRDGTLTTLQANLVFDAGSNPGAPVGMAGILVGSSYRWEHLLVEGTEVLTHKVSTGAYRAPGAPQAAFAIESMLDDVARELNLDPLELRRKNAVREGDLRVDGTRWPRIGLQEVLEQAAPLYAAERSASQGHPGEGVGIALGGWPGGIQPAAAACRLNGDGTLQITLGSVDLTGTNTTFQIIAAEAFGLADPGQVRVVTADTDTAPEAGATGGSKITYTVGPAVQRAAEDAREQVLRIAAAELEASLEDLEIVDGRVQVRGVPSRRLSLRRIYQLSSSFGAKYTPVFGRGQAAITTRAPGFAIHVVRVQVDAETGRVTPLRYIVVQDVGRAINPATVEGQIHGGAAQAVGWGLFERMAFGEDGTLLTGSLMDYTIPGASQIPAIEAHLVEVPSTAGPYGAKGVGEPPVIAGAPALANAVRDAVGVRVTEIPLTPERVQRQIAAGRGAPGNGAGG